MVDFYILSFLQICSTFSASSFNSFSALLSTRKSSIALALSRASILRWLIIIIGACNAANVLKIKFKRINGYRSKGIQSCNSIHPIMKSKKKMMNVQDEATAATLSAILSPIFKTGIRVFFAESSI